MNVNVDSQFQQFPLYRKIEFDSIGFSILKRLPEMPSLFEEEELWGVNNIVVIESARCNNGRADVRLVIGTYF